MANPKIRVVYWVGTTQKEATAYSYRQAMRFASRGGGNACGPRFYTEAGEQLVDLGRCLVELTEADAAATDNRPAVAYA